MGSRANCGDVARRYRPTSRRDAEGTAAEFARFCSIAMGSASELEYHLPLACDLKMIKPKEHAELSQRAIELKRMLTALLRKLKADR
jgi:four helix bundle protein